MTSAVFAGFLSYFTPQWRLIVISIGMYDVMAENDDNFLISLEEVSIIYSTSFSHPSSQYFCSPWLFMLFISSYALGCLVTLPVCR